MYRSFLLRVWYQEEGKRAPGWQAEIQQIQSGESWTFSNQEALLEFLDRVVGLTVGSSNEDQRQID